MASLEPLPQYVAQAAIAPVMMGNCFNILLYGFVLCTFFHHSSTYSWKRASPILKSITFFVVFLSTAMIGLDMHDIWHYSTMIDRDLVHVIKGNLPECFKPAILGLLGVVVQGVLVARTSKAMPSRVGRAIYLTLFGGLMIFELFSAAVVSAWSVHFHRTLSFSDWFGFTFPTSIAAWMWSAAITDFVISSVYLYVIWQNLKGGSEVVESVMRLIVRLTLQSALPTAIFAMTTAILTQIVGNKSIMTELVPYAFWNPLPSLYTLSLFTTLSIAEQATQSAKIWSPDLENQSGLTTKGQSHSHAFTGFAADSSFVNTSGLASPDLGAAKQVKPIFLSDFGGYLGSDPVTPPKSESGSGSAVKDTCRCHFEDEKKEGEKEKEELGGV